MIITNIRLGHATNSSSSHSVVVASGAYELDKTVSVYPTITEFGWDNFVAGDNASRIAYMICGILGSFPRDVGKNTKIGVTRELFRGTGHEVLVEQILDSVKRNEYNVYIDHQSMFTFPNVLGDNADHVFKESLEFFLDKRVTFHGGNDNDGWDDEGRGGGALCDDGTTIRVRRDGDHYVVFNMNTGAKVTLSPTGSSGMNKATKPELVDLKITDYCPYGCVFCYQGSTRKGKDASLHEINKVLDVLGPMKMGAFEIAVGGGEPTMHENFDSVIDAIASRSMVPNFTTFGVDWLTDDKKAAAARRCGGIGVSVQDARDLNKVVKIKNALGTRPIVVAQHVFGTSSVEDTIKLIETAASKKIHLLLLGYKNVGRGNEFAPFDMTGVVRGTALKKALQWHIKTVQLSVDTAFADQHAEFLTALGAMSCSYRVEEGKHSMYVDAVAKKYGPSSYCDNTEMIEYHLNDGLGDKMHGDFLRW